MKRILIILFCLLPCVAQASKIANCDKKPYDVTIVNGGHSRVVTIAPGDASTQEFGPTVSFQLEGQKPVVVTEEGEEYCIWSGKIKIQRRNPGNDQNGGFDLR
jgi:hypothetical protein